MWMLPAPMPENPPDVWIKIAQASGPAGRCNCGPFPCCTAIDAGWVAHGGRSAGWAAGPRPCPLAAPQLQNRTNSAPENSNPAAPGFVPDWPAKRDKENIPLFASR
jgi:hypothetical protein